MCVTVQSAALPADGAFTAAAYTSFAPTASPSSDLLGRMGDLLNASLPGHFSFKAPSSKPFYLVFTQLSDMSACVGGGDHFCVKRVDAGCVCSSLEAAVLEKPPGVTLVVACQLLHFSSGPTTGPFRAQLPRRRRSPST